MKSCRLRTQCNSRDICSTPRMHYCSQNLNKEPSDIEAHAPPFILTCWIQQNLDCGEGGGLEKNSKNFFKPETEAECF